MKGFKWLNESSMSEKNGQIIIEATPNSDYFCHTGIVSEEGITPKSLTNAPFYYTEIAGDFVFKAKAAHDFKNVYDSASLMVFENDQVWGKACFELTDFYTHAVVSVVTNVTSDDANGCNIDSNEVWLQISRVGNSFAFHYSVDGVNFFMMRFFTLPVGPTVKVGFLAQSPGGDGGNRYYSEVSIENRTVKNIRMGK